MRNCSRFLLTEAENMTLGCCCEEEHE